MQFSQKIFLKYLVILKDLEQGYTKKVTAKTPRQRLHFISSFDNHQNSYHSFVSSFFPKVTNTFGSPRNAELSSAIIQFSPLVWLTGVEPAPLRTET